MSGSEIEVRRAVPADAARLARLRYEFRAALDPAAESEEQFAARCAEWMRERLAAGDPWHCWIAERQGEIVATIWVQVFDKLPNPVAERERHAYITSLYVRPELRDAGIGSALLDQAIAACEARAVDAVLLWPTRRSRTLYERHGFVVGTDLLERRLAPVQGRDQ
ncbi:MAG TPA: GNAT family N-acetyltransferase [Gemmatimonadales bacterium]|nr:GNAT family N-acetyltransferase [Gemmatimonadales bacterium]